MHWTHRERPPIVSTRRGESHRPSLPDIPPGRAGWHVAARHEQEAAMTTTTSFSMREAALQASRDRVLGTTRDSETLLAQATGVRMVAAWTLVPAPRDPVRHLEAAHARARSH